MGIISKIKGVFGKDSSEPVEYVMKVKPPNGNWQQVTNIPLQKFGEIDEPEKLEDPKPRHSYKLVEVINKDGKEGETIWTMKGVESAPEQEEIEELVKEQLGQKVNESQSGGSGTGNGIENLAKAFEDLEKQLDEMEQIADVADRISKMFGKGGRNQSGNVEYKGELPVYMSPQAQQAVQSYVEGIADSVTKKVKENIVEGGGGSDKIDNKLDETLSDDENEEEMNEKFESELED